MMVVWLSTGIIAGLLNKETGINIIFSWVRFFLRLYGIDVDFLLGDNPSMVFSGKKDISKGRGLSPERGEPLDVHRRKAVGKRIIIPIQEGARSNGNKGPS